MQKSLLTPHQSFQRKWYYNFSETKPPHQNLVWRAKSASPLERGNTTLVAGIDAGSSAKKIIVVLGPTASGKSDLAVKIAKRFNGEIISADSRQVYKGMDIGTGKVPKDRPNKKRIKTNKTRIFEKNSNLFGDNSGDITKNSGSFGDNSGEYIYEGIPHYLLDVASPKRKFTVVQYRNLALRAIDKIFKKEKIPILCGGTGFYIQAVVDGTSIPEVKPDWRLRSNLNKLSADRLYQILKKLDPERAKTIERKNPRRLIRAIEIATKIGPVPILKKKPLPYPVLMIGIKKSKKELKDLIKKRFLKWLKMGLIAEVKRLRKLGLSWKRIEDFGIHYRVITHYLQKKLNYQQIIKDSLRELENYAKRQMTWFKRDQRIHWIKNYQETEKLVKKFLRK